MQTAIAFVELLLGFVPMAVGVAFILVPLWISIKLFPQYAERVNATFDRLMGVDEEYDEKYATGYAYSSNHR